MPSVNLAINNAFENFKIGQMMGSMVGGMNNNYPPPPPPPMRGQGFGNQGLGNQGLGNQSLNITNQGIHNQSFGIQGYNGGINANVNFGRN